MNDERELAPETGRFEEELGGQDEGAPVLHKEDIDELSHVIADVAKKFFKSWTAVESPAGDRSIHYLARSILYFFGNWTNFGRLVVALGAVYLTCRPDPIELPKSQTEKPA